MVAIAESATEKTCRKCGVSKPLEAFSPDKRRKFGCAAYCRDCKSASDRERRWKAKGIPDSDFPRLHARHALNENMRQLNKLFGAKRCPSCDVDLPVEEFNVSVSRPDGLQGHCRTCEGEYYADNAESILEQKAVYYAENAEAIRERHAEYDRSPEGRDAKRRSREKRDRAPSCRHALSYALELLEEADIWGCFWCSSELTAENTHVDHVHPLSRLGTGYGPNLVFACSECNLTKNARPTFAFSIDVVRELHGVDISGHAPAELGWSPEELEGWPEVA